MSLGIEIKEKRKSWAYLLPFLLLTGKPRDDFLFFSLINIIPRDIPTGNKERKTAPIDLTVPKRQLIDRVLLFFLYLKPVGFLWSLIKPSTGRHIFLFFVNVPVDGNYDQREEELNQ